MNESARSSDQDLTEDLAWHTVSLHRRDRQRLFPLESWVFLLLGSLDDFLLGKGCHMPGSTRSNVRSAMRKSGMIGGLVLMLSLLIAPHAGAQSTPVPQSDIRTISVSGTGRVNVDPDTTDVSLGVETTNASLEAAQTEVTEGLASVTKILTDAGVAAEDIVTSSYDIYPIPEYDRDGNYQGVSGYRVAAVLTVTIRDITQVGTILDSAVGGGATGVFGVRFYVADPSGPAREARSLAVEDARAKAKEYATASGVLITGVFSVVETTAPEPAAREQEFDIAASDAAGSAEPLPVPISPGQSEIRVDVDIIFEIEQANG